MKPKERSDVGEKNISALVSNSRTGQAQWFTLVIQATQEVGTRMIKV
jgi:hypothetical protein